MSEAAQKCPSLVTAWRVAYILTGCREGATKVIQESIDELLQHPGVHNRQRLEMLFYSILRRRCLRFPARCEVTGPLAELHALGEPERSARVLLEANALDAEEIQHLLNITKLPPAAPENPALAEALGQLVPTPEEDRSSSRPPRPWRVATPARNSPSATRLPLRSASVFSSWSPY